MSARQPKRGSGSRERPPAAPQLPDSWSPAPGGDYRLEDEALARRIALIGRDLSGQSAESIEFDQCRLRDVDLAGACLTRSALMDCVIEHGSMANLRTEKSSMTRVGLSVLRMTGLHWIDGVWRDVTVSQCRADLSSFRFTEFHNVRFEDCNLARADFHNADLRGVRFVNCDLTGARFSHATLDGARFARCQLAGIGGVTNLAGATVTSHDLVELSHVLAAALGIRIDDTDET